MAFDTDNKNDFAASSVRAFLNGDFLEELAAAGADKEAFAPIVLDLTSDDGFRRLRHGQRKDRAYHGSDVPRVPQNHSESVGRLLDLYPVSTERNGYKSFVRYVSTSGALNSNNACSGIGGVRPLCALEI